MKLQHNQKLFFEYRPIRLMVPRQDLPKIEPISRLNHYQKCQKPNFQLIRSCTWGTSPPLTDQAIVDEVTGIFQRDKGEEIEDEHFFMDQNDTDSL